MPQKRVSMSCHHVCGVHETASGINRCHHGDEEPTDHPAYLEYESVPHKAMREVMMGAKLRKKIPFVARYRSVMGMPGMALCVMVVTIAFHSQVGTAVPGTTVSP